MPEGSFPGEYVEVSIEHFRGSLTLPVFNGPISGAPIDCGEAAPFPAGRRTCWRDGTGICAVKVETPIGPRYWLAPHMPIRTEAEALDELSRGLLAARNSVIASMRARDQRRAEAEGKTVEEWKRDEKWRLEREARRNAARQYQDRAHDAVRRLAATGKLKD